MNSYTYPKQVAVLGFDAMDVDLVRTWASAGYLPTFQRLFETCAWSDFKHPPEYSSGTVWSSINTGLAPHEHDFYYLPRFLKESYRVRFGRPADLNGEFYWRALAEAGRRIVIADVPFSVPEPELGGLQYWGWCQHDWITKRASVPRSLLRKLTQQFGRHPVEYCGKYSMTRESLGQLKAGLADGISRRTSLLRSLIKSEAWDFFYAVFSEAHCAGHLMWSHESSQHPDGNLLREVYKGLDAALGGVIAACPPESAFVVFFSHGMGPNYHADHLFPEFLRRFHLRLENGEKPLPMAGDRKVRGSVATIWQHSIGRIPEAWRRRAESWLPSDVRSWLILKRDQSPRVWARMPGFALPMSDGHSALRVNLVGRESDGRVQDVGAYQSYLDALVAEIFSLTHTDTGEPAAEAVFRPDGNLDPMALRAAPDLLIWWRKSRPFRSLRSPSLGIIAGEPIDVRPGEHIMHGMLLLSHAHARRGYCATEGLTALDIAPTICVVAGVQPPRTLPGTDRSKEWLAASD